MFGATSCHTFAPLARDSAIVRVAVWATNHSQLYLHGPVVSRIGLRILSKKSLRKFVCNVGQQIRVPNHKKTLQRRTVPTMSPSRQDEHLLDVALTRARLGLQSASHVHHARAVGVAGS